MEFKDYFKNKKITMLGLGLLGRGVNVGKFLAENGAQLTITDLKTKEQLKSSLKKLKKFKNITYVLGEHRLKDFRNRDMIIKAAGVPLDSSFIKEAQKNKIPIEMDASLFMRLAPRGVTIVGITGTRGKTTVTNLIYEILKCAGKRVFLGGNIRGIATLPLLKKVKPGDVVVLELDSWQLQGFGDAKLSPHVSVFTNFMRDHMNYYRGDMDQYFNDKTNIFKYQKKGDTLVLGKQIALEIMTHNNPKPRFGNFGNLQSKARLWIVGRSSVPISWKVKILGIHNRENVALAMRACQALGVDEKAIKQGVENFKGVPGRLEFVRVVRGVKYYNDTTATTPDGNRVALAALSGKKRNIILIAGGNDKELIFDEMARNINRTVKALALIKGTATDKIVKLLPKKTKYPMAVVGNMKDAIRFTHVHARRGDTVLLSPGAASFGIFKNEYDRGDQFNKLVSKL
ncbi:MAG: UDP-N-acetylmuramoyl-L-alanine--D-glutamate ligase [bacterium]|nr:UDP-N-acetylmuramoyl-L-alanine--D-glutamate ligase [bacterium]